MPMHVTYEMVREDLPHIIDARGWDFEYKIHPGSGDTCMYIWNGVPDCLIGCYLVDLGLPIEAFKAIEGQGIDAAFVSDHLEKYGFTADPEAINALESVQNLQDSNATWGEAYSIVFE